MTSPRRDIFQEDLVGYYHCSARCVRRAFLCGKDPYSGRDYNHRKQWIKQRLTFLVEVFAIDLAGFGVMDNHLHTLISNRPDLAASWSADEVARRWRTLFPFRYEQGKPAEPNELEIKNITSKPHLVREYRRRLSSISWFHRCLNEHIAKMANAEDGCTGRFWEGRFRSKRIESIGALITCLVYIDLNPIRAGIAKTPEESKYTSIQDRIKRYVSTAEIKDEGLPPLLSIEQLSAGSLSTADYIELVDITGRKSVSGKGSIPDRLESILTRLRINTQRWVETTSEIDTLFRRIVAPPENIQAAAVSIGKAWMHGMAAARVAFA